MYVFFGGKFVSGTNLTITCEVNGAIGAFGKYMKKKSWIYIPI